MNSQLPLETLAGHIKAHVEKGDKATGKAEEHYKAAGIHLIEARKRVQETPGMTWPAFLAGHCTLGRGRANELIRLAEGRTTLNEIRAGTRSRVAAHRARKRRYGTARGT